MRVLGSEATQALTRLKMEICSSAAEREHAFIDQNIARKLTPMERREKKKRKLFDEPTTLKTIVFVYKTNDLSNKQNQFKVDINAHESRLTGCTLMYDEFSIVVVEGGGKSSKRYGKLMLRRINWAAKLPSEDEEEEDEEKGVAKPSFYRFLNRIVGLKLQCGRSWLMLVLVITLILLPISLMKNRRLVLPMSCI